MTHQNTNNVFCNDCGKLALAQLNATPYCTSCLMHQIDSTGQRRRKKYIKPLSSLDESDIWQDRWPEQDYNGMQMDASPG